MRCGPTGSAHRSLNLNGYLCEPPAEAEEAPLLGALAAAGAGLLAACDTAELPPEYEELLPP